MEHKTCNNIGITENGDICYDFSWLEKLQEVNILITKELTPRLIEKLIENKNKIILHITCTGNGGTELEPNVPFPEKLLFQTKNLIKNGFPKEQLVLRIDPIILNDKYFLNSLIPLRIFKGLIKRVRFSFLNMFSFFQGKIFEITENIEKSFFMELFINESKDFFELETCSEFKNGWILNNSCVSEKDLKILNKTIVLIRGINNRKGCQKPMNIIELLNKNNCRHNCAYCFLKK